METTRNIVLKTSVNPAESITLRREVSLARTTISRQARQLLTGWAAEQAAEREREAEERLQREYLHRSMVDGKRSFERREGPSDMPRRAQLILPRRSYGVIPKMHMRV